MQPGINFTLEFITHSIDRFRIHLADGCGKLECAYCNRPVSNVALVNSDWYTGLNEDDQNALLRNIAAYFNAASLATDYLISINNL